MPSQGNHPSQLKHYSCRPDRTATQLSHHRKELISFLLLQGGSTAMLACATLSYHCHCATLSYHCHCATLSYHCHCATLSYHCHCATLSYHCHCATLSYHCHCATLSYHCHCATLSYHCHCCREGVLPCQQVPPC